MKPAIDSSSFAKRYVQEVGSDKLDHLLKNASELAFCVILGFAQKLIRNFKC